MAARDSEKPIKQEDTVKVSEKKIPAEEHKPIEEVKASKEPSLKKVGEPEHLAEVKPKQIIHDHHQEVIEKPSQKQLPAPEQHAKAEDPAQKPSEKLIIAEEVTEVKASAPSTKNIVPEVAHTHKVVAQPADTHSHEVEEVKKPSEKKVSVEVELKESSEKKIEP